MTLDLALLMLVVFAAFTVEASLGFGATVVTVALGSMLYPLDALLPAFVPLNVMLSTFLAARYLRHVDRRLLVRRILPLMLLGIPFGLFAFRALPELHLRRGFAVFVIVLAAAELWRLRRGEVAAALPLGRVQSSVLLLLGGVVHGAFATGGPLAVYVAGRELGDDKARFRSTLSALWLTLNLVLLASYWSMGRLGVASGKLSLWLLAPLALGLLAGEAAHARVPIKTFKVLVYVLLGLAGVVLLART